MDNILKLLLGVLGVAGLIAMVTPTNMVPDSDALPPASPASASTVAAGPPPNQSVAPIANAPQPSEQEFPQEEGDDFIIGEPTIDGNPIGVSGDQQQQPPQQQQNELAQTFPGVDFNYGSANMQSYMPPVSYGPQPAPGPFAGVDTSE